MKTHILVAFFIPLASPLAAQQHCATLENPSHVELCNCEAIESTVQRLDCYDNYVSGLYILRRKTFGFAKELADMPYGVEAMEWILERRTDAD